MPRSGSRILDRSVDCVYLRSHTWASITPQGVQLASARRAKCHTYQSTLLPPGPSRVVVDRCSWLAARVVQCYYSSSCVALLFSIASSRPLTYHQKHPIPFFVHELALPIHEPCIASTGTPPCSATHTSPRVFTSRPLGTAPANHSTLSKSRADDRRHQSRHPATTTINQDNHDKIKIYRRQSAEE